jgi:hypothetical protein
MTEKFELGRTVMTRGVFEWMKQDDFTIYAAVLECFTRHQSGDWGTVPDEDKQANDDALVNGDRVLSAYEIDGTKVWVITDWDREWDRSVTTVLFPEEY